MLTTQVIDSNMDDMKSMTGGGRASAAATPQTNDSETKNTDILLLHNMCSVKDTTLGRRTKALDLYFPHWNYESWNPSDIMLYDFDDLVDWCEQIGYPADRLRKWKQTLSFATYDKPFLYSQNKEVVRLDVLKWFVEKNETKRAHMDQHLVRAAAFAGRLECLKWAVENKFFVDEMSLFVAAYKKNLDCFIYLASLQSTRSKLVCMGFACVGDIRYLEWALDHGFPWSPKCTLAAVQQGHLHVLEWAMSRNLEFDNQIATYARFYQHQPIIRWLERFPQFRIQTFKHASCPLIHTVCSEVCFHQMVSPNPETTMVFCDL